MLIVPIPWITSLPMTYAAAARRALYGGSRKGCIALRASSSHREEARSCARSSTCGRSARTAAQASVPPSGWRRAGSHFAASHVHDAVPVSESHTRWQSLDPPAPAEDPSCFGVIKDAGRYRILLRVLPSRPSPYAKAAAYPRLNRCSEFLKGTVISLRSPENHQGPD